MKIITDKSCLAYSTPGHPERPARVLDTITLLQKQTELELAWSQPTPATETEIFRAHAPWLLKQLTAVIDLDADTPAYPDILDHARLAAGAAIAAMRSAREGKLAFSLMRPPGHHATRDQALGFCYLNSIAIAVLAALAEGAKRVAVFDFDVHHGNGTEAILLNHPATAFYSVHQFPCYPGTGRNNLGNNCFNFPVAPHVLRSDYRARLSEALTALKQFQPDLVAVSAGFDAYANDPLAQSPLEAEDFYWLGAEVRALGIPAFSILEGGYSDELPQLILEYLKGWQGI